MENKKTIPLRMLCKEITDGTRTATEFVDYKTNVPYIRLSNIKGGKLVQKEMKYLFDLDGIEEKAIVRKGDVLISKIISLPKLALVDETYDGAVISPDIIKIRPNDQQTQEKLKRFFSSDIGMLSLKKMAVPSILPKISLKQLGDLEIIIDEETEGDIRSEQTDLKQKLYSLYELEFNHINKSLSTEFWVKGQFLAERLDVDYYRYYTSDAFKLLKHKIKNEQWTQLKDICEIVTYTVSPKDFHNKEIRYIGFKNIDANACRIVSAETISFEKVKSRARYELKENDVLLGVVGPHIGEENHPLAFVTKEYEGALASSAFAVIRSTKLSAYYLLWCLKHPGVLFQMKMGRRGQLQLMISTESLKDLYIPILEQSKIRLIESLFANSLKG